MGAKKRVSYAKVNMMVLGCFLPFVEEVTKKVTEQLNKGKGAIVIGCPKCLLLVFVISFS